MRWENPDIRAIAADGYRREVGPERDYVVPCISAQTGIKAIDALVPIGKVRELIIGDRQREDAIALTPSL